MGRRKHRAIAEWRELAHDGGIVARVTDAERGGGVGLLPLPRPDGRWGSAGWLPGFAGRQHGCAAAAECRGYAHSADEDQAGWGHEDFDDAGGIVGEDETGRGGGVEGDGLGDFLVAADGGVDVVEV